MTQAKMILASLITVASLNIKAETMSGFLELSPVNGNIKIGPYFVGLALNPQPSAVLKITQSLVEAPTAAQLSEQAKVCLTEFFVVAGNLSLILTDAHNDETVTVRKMMNLSSNHYDETEKCSSIETLTQSPLHFTSFFPLTTTISVFPYGSYVVLNISKDTNNNFVIENLKTQLSAQLKRGNKKALRYNFSASDENSLLTQQGSIELK